MNPVLSTLYKIKQRSLLRFFLILILGYTPLTLIAQNNGQQSHDVSIEVNAMIRGSIELTTMRNMDFGKVQPGQETIDINPVQDVEAGKMVASGRGNAKIRVQYQRTWQLRSNRSDEPLTFNYRIAGSEEDNQETAELLETDNRDLNLNEEGVFYFWIGGRADITNAQPGNYEGEFTIEIEYI
jgi:hypothetical protein